VKLSKSTSGDSRPIALSGLVSLVTKESESAMNSGRLAERTARDLCSHEQEGAIRERRAVMLMAVHLTNETLRRDILDSSAIIQYVI
jgi:hypothetical protein